IAVILDGGFAPGRRTPVGQTFALRQFEDASGDQHLERGGDHAIPIGASMDGFFGPPLTVMHGCAATGETGGGRARGGRGGGGGDGGCHDALLSCCLSIVWSSSTTAPIRLAGAPLGERRSVCPISAGEALCWSNSDSRMAASAANASSIEFCRAASRNTSPMSPSGK